TIISLLTTQQWAEQLLSSYNFDDRHSITIFTAEKKLLETIVGFHLHQGIMAVGKVPQECSLQQTFSYVSKPALFVAIDGLMNAENVGVLVRNCVAFGVGAIIVGESSSSPYLRRAVRNSMGTVFQIKVIHSNNLAETLSTLNKEFNTNIVATQPEGSVSIDRVNVRDNVCLVFGSEGTGISQKVIDVCTDRVSIPMMNGIDSLNVASASAVILYEVRKQRQHIS
ncbi:MAG TPA: RNA methyltransferase, partial [Bacteroidota bacterium]|nr:RNA methyltransferase [Bacteroidota bacterium]